MIERLGWTLVHSLWQGAGVALLLSLALLATRRSVTRYGLACAALALLALVPIVTFLALDPSPASASALVVGISQEVSNPILGWMVWAWVAGVAVLSLRLVGSIVQLGRWKRHCTQPAEPGWQNRVDSLAVRLGIVKTVVLRVSDKIVVPCAWGILKPVLVLPACLATHLSQEQIEALLLHELAHVRRHDYLVNLLQAAIETVLFYHPATWWISRIVRQERENCCDDLVVAALGDPMPYAYALLRLEEARYMLPQPALSATGGSLKSRVSRLLARQPQPRSAFPFGSLLVAACVLGALLVTGVQAQSASESREPAKSARLSKATVGEDQPAKPVHRKRATRKPKRKAERLAPVKTKKVREAPRSSTPKQAAPKPESQPPQPEAESRPPQDPVTGGTVSPQGASSAVKAIFGDQKPATKADPKELAKLFIGNDPAGYRKATEQSIKSLFGDHKPATEADMKELAKLFSGEGKAPDNSARYREALFKRKQG